MTVRLQIEHIRRPHGTLVYLSAIFGFVVDEELAAVRRDKGAGLDEVTGTDAPAAFFGFEDFEGDYKGRERE